MNTPSPPIKPEVILNVLRQLGLLKPKWIATFVVLVIAYFVVGPWLSRNYGLALPGIAAAPAVVAPSKDVPAGDVTVAEKAPTKVRLPRPENSTVENEQPGESEVVTSTPSFDLPKAPSTESMPPRDRPTTPAVVKAPPTKTSTTKPATTPAKPSTTANSNPNTKPNPPPKTTANTPPVVKPTVPPTTPPKAKPGNNTATAPKKPEANPPAAPAGPALGELKEIGRNVFESTAGLIYRPGSEDGHRIDHVMHHGRDDLDKPVHGVFDGDKAEILAVIDEAWLIAQKNGPPKVKIEEQGDRTTYTVFMNRRIGYKGGQSGERQRRPAVKLIKLVLEGNNVVTAYPTER